MALHSMTGFASLPGNYEGINWVWEIRSVNGRGLDVRVRLPEGFEALEAPLRAEVAKVFSRGSISVALKMGRGVASSVPKLNPDVLKAVIDAAGAVSGMAQDAGLDLVPPSAVDLLHLRGVMEQDTGLPSDSPEVRSAVQGQIRELLGQLRKARSSEGERLGAILESRVDQIETLNGQARSTAEARSARSGELLRSRVTALLEATEVADEGRLAQELAQLAVKADVSEELDRLEAHVDAARTLISGKGPAGRKLDFLTQEFNREANTLCSKAGASDLTAIALELKVVIDQVREQVQNVE